MVLEKIGKLAFAQMRPFFFYLFLALPILCASGYLFFQKMALNELEERFSISCKKGEVALQRKGEKERFLEKYAQATPYFLDTQIESMQFLTREISDLEALKNHPALAEKKSIESRLRFLKGEENRLAFTEEAIRSSEQIKECEEVQRRTVQMDEDDLKQLLCIVEDTPIDSFSPPEGTPQITITDFQMEKKQSPLNTPVLQVEMKLLKREIKK